MIYDCLIIGAGPAGLAAAVQLARMNHKILILEKDKIGGLLNNANRVENYLGLPDFSGPELIKTFQKNLKKQAVSIRKEEVLDIQKNKSIFTVQTNKKSYESRTVLVATGTQAIRPWEGKNIYYEICDLPSSKKSVLIVGGGDVGFDYALNLKKRGGSPILWTHRKTTCLALLKKRAKVAKIPFFENKKITKITPEGKGLKVESGKEILVVDCILVAIGRKASMPKCHIQKPSQGLYFAGDVSHEATRQVQIAAGEGVHAALEISKSFISHANH
jgi:thioredoxin reductase